MYTEDLELYQSTHRYFYKGRLLIGVTEVFEATGLADFSKIKWEILEEAKLKGDYVHELARLVASKSLNTRKLDSRLEGYYAAIKKFFKEEVKGILAVETPVCDPYHGYAGTPDIVFVSHGDRLVLADYKTPDRPHATWKYQTAAYKNAWDKCFPDQKIRDRFGIMLSDDGEYKLHQHTGSQDFDKFLLCLGVAKIKMEEGIRT